MKLKSIAVLAHSELDGGTSFDLYLPAVSPTVSKREDHMERPVEGKGKILVMDDEEGIRNLCRRVLRLCGYVTEVAKDGAEALKLYERSLRDGKPFDVVVMDVVIRGGMGGLETLRRLRQIDSEVKAIVSSGYTNDDVMSNYSDYGFTGVLPKPYKFIELIRTVNQMIDS